MTSIVIKGSLYLARPDFVDKQGPFAKVFLAEGDSWMDTSSTFQASLPYYLTQEFNRRGKSYLIINISESGDTLRRISETMKGDFVWWLKQQTFSGILFSAGGNDFIDAARDPAPGQGLLHDMAGRPSPVDGYECVRQPALAELVGSYLQPNFEGLYQALRKSSKNASTPMFLNCYDTPVARDAPALRNKVGPWLYTAYKKNSIAPTLWPSLTQGVFSDVRKLVESWSQGRTGVTAVATTGLLTPADPASQGSSGDWRNEIHPNASGWRKQARVWADVLG